MSIRRYFISGLLLWIPILVTLFVVEFLVRILDKSIALIPHAYQPTALLGFDVPGVGVVLSLLIVFFTGMLVSNFIGHKFVHAWDSLIGRIPLVRTIYSGVKQTLHTMFSPEGKAFRKVMLLQYPRKGLWCIAFQTSEDSEVLSHHAGEQLLALFMPTTPNPTSGFLILAPKSEVIELKMSVDEAMKMIISLGVVQPRKLVDHPAVTGQAAK